VPLLVIFSYILLVLVLVNTIGIEVWGARRWLRLGFFRFQPAEVAKLVALIYLASFVSRKKILIPSFKRGLLPPMLVCLGMSGLILLQPDLGNAIFLIIITLLILIIAGIKIRYLITMGLVSFPFIFFLIFCVPYRRDRIIAFLNPWDVSRGVGFQLVQSYLAFGSGGIFGVGLGMSKQKLFYLPASHTDFIFSIIGEELGFLGAFVVSALFFVLFFIGFKIALSKTDLFARILALGIVFNLSLQAVLNIAVTTGLIPTKGLPLPFISYGGTNLVVNMAQIALLLNISKNAT